ncbi:MAG: DinB family protein [Bryobacteraceae bacterium]
MPISAALLPEFDHEMATTRRCLERVPDDKFAWKPHDRSMELGRLASHLAEMPTWAVAAFAKDTLDLATEYSPFHAKSNAEVLAAFDRNVAAARVAIAAATDDAYMTNWSLVNGSTVMLTMPKIVVVRSFVLNHVLHHRGQLSVYLRMNDIPVPSIYGPSADEGQM